MTTLTGLSCLTVNLPAYLRTTEPDPAARIARTVHLAVRADAPEDQQIFSHHRHSLGHLADGRHLRYQSTDEPLLLAERLQQLIQKDGSVLVVAYAGAMPWSLAHNTDGAPHLIRLTARLSKWWQVDDQFTALLPDGEQLPYDGWITTTQLRQAMRAPQQCGPEHRLRKEHALGVPLPVPADSSWQWLEPADTLPQTLDADVPTWLTGPTVLDRLSRWYADLGECPDRARYVDDMWAAAQHHTFRYAHLRACHELNALQHTAIDAAVTAWSNLPMALRFAVDSARRGRPRPAVVTSAFEALLEAETGCAPFLYRYGYLSERTYAASA